MKFKEHIRYISRDTLSNYLGNVLFVLIPAVGSWILLRGKSPISVPVWIVVAGGLTLAGVFSAMLVYRVRLTRLLKEHKILHRGIEFRRGRHTRGVWTAFCPVCGHLVNDPTMASGDRWATCSVEGCKWVGVKLTAGGLAVLTAELNETGHS